MRTAPQLMTYPDSLGGDLPALDGLLRGPLDGLFGGVHILPPFPSSGDRGFAPLTYGQIDARFGTWSDVERIAQSHDVLLDVMINHLSRRSVEFEEFLQNGRRSSSADLFITLDKVWPDGNPPADDVARIFLRKPDAPFSTITVEATGETERIWTSFGSHDWSEQIDLDVTSPATRSMITGLAAVLRRARGHDRPARRRRLRHQEGRHQLLHGRARDLRLPRLDHRGRGRVRSGHPAGGPRPLRHPRATRGARVLDVRLRPARAAPARLRDWIGCAAVRPPGTVAGAPVHDARLPRRHPGPAGP